MALSSGFISSPDVSFPQHRIISAILIGIIASVVLFGFITYLREGFAIAAWDFSQSRFSVKQGDKPYYDLFFAYLTSIAGCSLGLTFLLRNRNKGSNPKVRLWARFAITNQYYFSLNTVWWLAKVVSLLGVLCISWPLQYDIDFLRETTLFLILLPALWFLNLWLGFHKILRGRLLRWMGAAFLLVTINSLVVSRTIGPEVDRSRYQVSIHDLIQLDMPRSEYTQYYSNTEPNQIYVGFDKERQGGEPVYAIKRFVGSIPEIVSLPEVVDFIEDRSDWLRAWDWKRPILTIKADKDVPYKSILKIRSEASALGVKSVFYMLGDPKTSYPSDYPFFEDRLMHDFYLHECEGVAAQVDSLMALGYIGSQVKWPENYCYEIMKVAQMNRVLLQVAASGFSLNGSAIDLNRLKILLTSFYQKYNQDAVVMIKYLPDCTFGQFIAAQDLFLDISSDRKNTESLKRFGKEYSVVMDSKSARKIDSLVATRTVELLDHDQALLNFVRGN